MVDRNFALKHDYHDEKYNTMMEGSTQHYDEEVQISSLEKYT
jgi:hypothetical protein